MTDSNSQTPLAEQDYDAIQDAVMETSRGRWFLSEYARRNRNSDTNVLLDAIKKLENAMVQPAESLEREQVRFDLMEMASEIAQTRLDIAAIAPKSGGDNHLSSVASELDLVVGATEDATYKILTGAENVQEAVWNMRDRGVDEADCQVLEKCATDIFSACEFQDLTGQRIAKVVNVVGYIEERLNSMIEIWGDDTLINLNQPSDDLEITNSYLQSHVAITQDTVDDLMFTEGGAAIPNTAGALPPPQPINIADDVVIDTNGALPLPDDADLLVEGHDGNDASGDADAMLELESDSQEEQQDPGLELEAEVESSEDPLSMDTAADAELDNLTAPSLDTQAGVDVDNIDGLSQNEKVALFT